MNYPLLTGSFGLLACRDSLLLDASLPVTITGALPTLTKRTTTSDGSVAMASIQKRKGWWVRIASKEFPVMAEAAKRLLSAHATTGAPERNWSQWSRVYGSSKSQLKVETAEKLIFINGNQRVLDRVQAPSFEVCMDLLGIDSDADE